MSLESDVAGILRNDPVGRIHFSIEAASVNKMRMEFVAKAIDAREIAVKSGTTGSLLGAAYSSFKSRRFAEGEKKIAGEITVGSQATLRPLGRASIFHESVHALIDLKGPTLSMHNDEVIAYLADAMYLRATKTTVAGGALETAIFNAAFAIVDKHQLLTRHNVKLKWTDCDALRDAIKAHPAY